MRLAGPQRKDGHDVLEIDERQQQGDYPSVTRKMCNYMSIGVQGYVGSGFEKHRAGNRFANMMVYTCESAKWVFWRRFPAVTNFIEKIIFNGETVLECPGPEDKTTSNSNAPIMTKHPIDFVIQNIPHIWYSYLLFCIFYSYVHTNIFLTGEEKSIYGVMQRLG